MKFKIDENIPLEVSMFLSDNDYDCSSVYDEQLGGADDAVISLACKTEGRILITFDLDFADIRAYPPDECAGIIVLRLNKQDKISVLKVMGKLLPHLKVNDADKSLWIVDDSKIRVRDNL
jgi:predicted nuclease of predicted toxin-antitoxin system